MNPNEQHTYLFYMVPTNLPEGVPHLVAAIELNPWQLNSYQAYIDQQVAEPANGHLPLLLSASYSWAGLMTVYNADPKVFGLDGSDNWVVPVEGEFEAPDGVEEALILGEALIIDGEAPMRFGVQVDKILYESNYFESIQLVAAWQEGNLDPEGKPPIKG